jgi:hypothetical protein
MRCLALTVMHVASAGRCGTTKDLEVDHIDPSTKKCPLWKKSIA